MKITRTRTHLVELPADEPLAGAADNPNGKRPIVTLRVETDGGIEGIIPNSELSTRRVNKPEEVLRALFSDGIGLRDLEVAGADLEEAVLALTARNPQKQSA